MSTIGEVDLAAGLELAVGGRRLHARGIDLWFTDDAGEPRVQVPTLRRSDYAAHWTDGERVLIVGLLSPDVVLADAHLPRPCVIGSLDRLDLSDTYDPGGLERITFVDVRPGRVAVIHEIGVALVDLDERRIRWQRVHDDIQASFHGLSDGVLRFESDNGAFGIREDHGDWLVLS